MAMEPLSIQRMLNWGRFSGDGIPIDDVRQAWPSSRRVPRRRRSVSHRRWRMVVVRMRLASAGTRWGARYGRASTHRCGAGPRGEQVGRLEHVRGDRVPIRVRPRPSLASGHSAIDDATAAASRSSPPASCDEGSSLRPWARQQASHFDTVRTLTPPAARIASSLPPPPAPSTDDYADTCERRATSALPWSWWSRSPSLRGSPDGTVPRNYRTMAMELIQRMRTEAGSAATGSRSTTSGRRRSSMPRAHGCRSGCNGATSTKGAPSRRSSTGTGNRRASGSGSRR